MKRILLSLLMILLLLPAMAQAPVEFADDLTGVYFYPEDATEDTARYVYRYCYPQLAGDSEVAALINTTYQYTAADALGFEAPMLASEMQEGDERKVVDISYRITCVTAEHLSVVVTKTVTSGTDVSTVTSGHVFSLTGGKAGSITSLPYLLGILEADETDEWYLERQTAKADDCVRELVWAQLQAMNGDTLTLYEDLTYEEFEAGFYPEEDFYLNENGDPVFYLMPGAVAPREYGETHIIITLEELLDEI